ncbi:unnamed protein product [Paramecium pentaurelia]|uniref:Uncharacterized protein n=1 Tax=Paramecium pentaurelia TaxID=43138 RepID=A0A8S1SBG7_9CILI|nr:unnamed protein product [Paramecium pentaurelia]
MNYPINPSLDLSQFNNLLNKQIKRVTSKKERKAIQKEQKYSNKLKNEAKYICELIRPLAEQEKQQQEVSNTNEKYRQRFGYLLLDIYSYYFKIIAIQNQKNELIVHSLPFQQNKIFELKINFPFYLFLEQVSNFQVCSENQKNIFSPKQLEIPQEIIEFIVDHNQNVIGCNRIVNKCWLKMLGINSDMIIHYVQQSQTFPIGWIADGLKSYNFYQDVMQTQSISICLTNYNGQKFNAQIQIKYEQEIKSKNKIFERYIISYIINRKQLSLQQIEQNFANYFGINQISKELASTFIEHTNKQCGIKYI